MKLPGWSARETSQPMRATSPLPAKQGCSTKATGKRSERTRWKKICGGSCLRSGDSVKFPGVNHALSNALRQKISQFNQHSLHRQFFQSIWRSQDRDVFAQRTPHRCVARAPKGQAGQANGRGQMCDSRVMTDKTGAPVKTTSQLGQWQTARQLDSAKRSHSGQSLQPRAFRFAADEQQVQIRCREQVSDKQTPVFLRPVFLFTAAAWMQCQPAAVCWQRGIHVSEFEAWSRLVIEDGESFEWFEKSFGGVPRKFFIRPMRAGDELCGGTAGNVFLKNAVGVVEIRKDDCKVREVIGETRIQLSVPREESSQ